MAYNTSINIDKCCSKHLLFFNTPIVQWIVRKGNPGAAHV